MKNYLLFDLDGTLTDPKVGITKSVAHSLEYFDIHVDNLDILTPFIGPPLKESYAEFYGFTAEQCEMALQKYREYFSVTGLYENEVYEGIPEMLASLQKAGKKLIVATSKPEPYSRQILEHFDLAKYFDIVAGSDMAETRVKKGEVIAYALEKVGKDTADRENVIMVGDRKHDILGAKENQLEAIGVLYGYGNLKELRQAGADHVVNSVKELGEILEKL